VQPPTWLSKDAKAEWRARTPELTRLGLLTDLDVLQFAAYCTAAARWMRYERRLELLARKVDGELVETPNGFQQPHAIVKMARDAAEQMRKFAALFGLSPADRASLSMPLDPTAPKLKTSDKPAAVAPRADEFTAFLNRERTTRVGTDE
jgi:P27 family predicted phage terminase small subunit